MIKPKDRVLSFVYKIFRVALREFRILMRSRWGYGLLAFFAIFSASVIGFGTSRVGPGSYESVVVSLVEFGVYLVPLAALTAGYDTVVGDYEAGTLDMLFALPVSRSQVLVGKYFGRLGVLLGALIIGLGVGGTMAVWIVGPGGLKLYSLFVVISGTIAAIFLGLGVLVSTVTEQRIRALGYTQIVWLWFVLLHDLLALGIIVEFDLPEWALSVMVLLNPTDLYRLVLLGQFEARAGGFASLLSETSMTMPVLVSALIGWLVVPLVLSNILLKK